MIEFITMTYVDINILIKVTHAPVVPPLVLFLSKHPLVEKFDLSSLVEVTSGAAPLGKELENSLRHRFPNIIMKQGTIQHSSKIKCQSIKSNKSQSVGQKQTRSLICCCFSYFVCMYIRLFDYHNAI